MFIISQKRIKIILSCILISVLVFSMQSTKEDNSKKDGTVKQVASLPVSGKTIVVDAGHGVPDEGVSLLH